MASNQASLPQAAPKKIRAIAKRRLRAGVFRHPEKPIWCICYCVNKRYRWEEIGTLAEAEKAFAERRRMAYQEIERTKHARHLSFPKPFRSGPFEHPAGSDVWWIGYYDAEARRHREQIGSREDAEKAYAAFQSEVAQRNLANHWGRDPERKRVVGGLIAKAKGTPEQRQAQGQRAVKMWQEHGDEISESMRIAGSRSEIRLMRQHNAIESYKVPEVRAARLAGLAKGVQAAADPEVRARSQATKMREKAAAVGRPWTDGEFDEVVRSLVKEIIEDRANRPPRQSGAGKVAAKTVVSAPVSRGGGPGAPKKQKHEHEVFGETVQGLLGDSKRCLAILAREKRAAPLDSQRWISTLRAAGFSAAQISDVWVSRNAKTLAIRWACRATNKELKTGQNLYSAFLRSQLPEK